MQYEGVGTRIWKPTKVRDIHTKEGIRRCEKQEPLITLFFVEERKGPDDQSNLKRESSRRYRTHLRQYSPISIEGALPRPQSVFCLFAKPADSPLPSPRPLIGHPGRHSSILTSRKPLPELYLPYVFSWRDDCPDSYCEELAWKGARRARSSTRGQGVREGGRRGGGSHRILSKGQVWKRGVIQLP